MQANNKCHYKCHYRRDCSVLCCPLYVAVKQAGLSSSGRVSLPPSCAGVPDNTTTAREDPAKNKAKVREPNPADVMGFFPSNAPDAMHMLWSQKKTENTSSTSYNCCSVRNKTDEAGGIRLRRIFDDRRQAYKKVDDRGHAASYDAPRAGLSAQRLLHLPGGTRRRRTPSHRVV